MTKSVRLLLLSLSCVMPFAIGVSIAAATAPLPSSAAVQGPPPTPDYWPRDVVVITQPIPNGEGCACDGVDGELELELTLPTGIQFTGQCTPNGCAFNPVGSTTEPFTVVIPANHCIDGITVHMITDAPIVVCTEDSQCPTGFYPATSYQIISHVIPCPEIEPVEPGGEAVACGTCTQ